MYCRCVYEMFPVVTRWRSRRVIMLSYFVKQAALVYSTVGLYLRLRKCTIYSTNIHQNGKMRLNILLSNWDQTLRVNFKQFQRLFITYQSSRNRHSETMLLHCIIFYLTDSSSSHSHIQGNKLHLFFVK